MTCEDRLLTSAVPPRLFAQTETLVQVKMGAGVKASPVKANPAPRDYYKVADRFRPDNEILCGGLVAMPIAAGNLEACAVACTKCGDICRGFVDDGDAGKCVFKSASINAKCEGKKCHKDGYEKCPQGTWSDGFANKTSCFPAAFGFQRRVGAGPWPAGGTNLACNKGEISLELPSNDLGKCASMCRGCNIGGAQCTAFVRTQATTGKGSVCTFKSLFTTLDKVGSSMEAYQSCRAGEWADGLNTGCYPGPVNYAAQFGKKGGNAINCVDGSLDSMALEKDKDLNKCASVCTKCMVGTKTCNGFVFAGNRCHFKSASSTSDDNVVKILGGKKNVGAVTYKRCGAHQFASGSDATCGLPKDYQITVSTGTKGACTCNEKSVREKRFSSSKWTFDVLDAQEVPLFLKDKPFIAAPCTSASDANCKRAVSANFTAGAGSTPKWVKISADKDDAWCMKTFCLASVTLKKRWVPKKPQGNWKGQLFMNTGLTKDGSCAPTTTSFPNNNWGWCRFISATDAQTTQATMSTCNEYQDYKKAFWQLELVEEDGDCKNIPLIPALSLSEKTAAEEKKTAEAKKAEEAAATANAGAAQPAAKPAAVSVDGDGPAK